MTMGCQQEDRADKIGFDLEILNEEGMYGPPDLLRTLEYEFCLPAGSFVRSKVMDIDPSLKCGEGGGYLSCQQGEVLCTGNTRQENHKRKLLALTRLDYIRRIEQSY